MTQLKCPKCEGLQFDAKPVKMLDGKTTYTFVYCNSCGYTLQVFDIATLGTLANTIVAELRELRR